MDSDGQFRLIDLNERQVGESAGPSIIQDSMEPLRNHADGRIYDSKSEFAKATRRAGCIEVGNEAMPLRRERDVAPGLKEKVIAAYRGELRSAGNRS